jgi:hypothetical protein
MCCVGRFQWAADFAKFSAYWKLTRQFYRGFAFLKNAVHNPTPEI